MLKEAYMLHEAAADAVEALAHLGLLAATTGHAAFAQTTQQAVGMLLGAPEARQIIPAEYVDAAGSSA